MMNRRIRTRLRPVRPVTLALRRLMAHDGIEIAGFIAYTGLVSLFPFVIFLFAVAGFVGNPETAQTVINAAFEQLPREVAQTLSPIINDIFKNQKPGLLTLGIVGTLWVTSSGVEALRVGCSRSWELREKRPFWRRRLTSIVFVAVGAVGVLAASLIVVVAPLVLNHVRTLVTIPEVFIVVATVLRLGLGLCLIAGTLALLYRYLPMRTIPWRRVLPGAWVAAALWIALASLFSLYLSNSGDYSLTYGSLGGIVITLLFLHFSAIIFLFGVEYSAVMAYRRGATTEKVALPRRAD